MSYRCRVWSISASGETELPVCTVEHKTIESALNCRNSRKGSEPLHRWEIWGGDFVVKKGEGQRGISQSGKVQGGISWGYSQDWVHGTERLWIAVDADMMVDMERKAHQRDEMKWNADFVCGMAYMLGSVAKCGDRSGPWIDMVRENLLMPSDAEELPANVIKGPWQSR